MAIVGTLVNIFRPIICENTLILTVLDRSAFPIVNVLPLDLVSSFSMLNWTGRSRAKLLKSDFILSKTQFMLNYGTDHVIGESVVKMVSKCCFIITNVWVYTFLVLQFPFFKRECKLHLLEWRVIFYTGAECTCLIGPSALVVVLCLMQLFGGDTGDVR